MESRSTPSSDADHSKDVPTLGYSIDEGLKCAALETFDDAVRRWLAAQLGHQI
jgi:hypothetical protein